MLDTALIERFSAIVGEKNALTAPEDLAAYLVAQRDLYPVAHLSSFVRVRRKKSRRS